MLKNYLTILSLLILPFGSITLDANELRYSKKNTQVSKEFIEQWKRNQAHKWATERAKITAGRNVKYGLQKTAEVHIGLEYCPFENKDNTALSVMLGFIGYKKQDIEQGGKIYPSYKILYEQAIEKADLNTKIVNKNDIYGYGSSKTIKVCDQLWKTFGPKGNLSLVMYNSRSFLECTGWPSLKTLRQLQSPQITANKLDSIISAAKKGEPKAQFELGWAYLKGEVIDKNLEEGIKWVRKSAEQGYVFAQNIMSAYYDNLNSDEYSKISFQWLKKAASQKKFSSHSSLLAWTYKRGRPGIEKDVQLAKKWDSITEYLQRNEKCNEHPKVTITFFG